MIGGFRHRGLEEIHLTGKTRRIGTEHIRKCVRILQLLEVAAQPEDMNIAGFRFHPRCSGSTDRYQWRQPADRPPARNHLRNGIAGFFRRSR